MKLFFDGGCRPNPGMMETAVVARGVVHHRGEVGVGTSHMAEWHALLHALQVACGLGERDVVLIGDAVNVIDQANRRTRCTNADAQVMLCRYGDAAEGFTRVRLRHVRRGQNLAGIALDSLRDEQVHHPS